MKTTETTSPSVRWWQWVTLAVSVPFLLALSALTVAPPMVNPDSAMGFLAWNSHASGAPWNHIREPDPADLSRDHQYFLTWWSPAQHDLTGIWREFGATWGQCIALTTLASCWMLFAGSWLLARRLGGTTGVATWFSVVSALQWHSLYGFGHFRGGEVLLGGATPWILLLAWETRHRPGRFLIVIPVLILGGQYLKLSSVLITGPALLAAGISNLWSLHRRPAAAVLWSLAALVLAGTSWLAFDVAFLGRGANPGSSQGVPENWFSLLSFSLASPLLAGTGLGSLVGNIAYRLKVNVEDLWRSGGWIVAPAALLTWWAVSRWILSRLRSLHRIGLIIVVGTSSALLGLILLRGSTVGVDDRFARPAATLLILALAFAQQAAPRRQAVVLRVILLSIAAFGLLAAAQRTHALARSPNRGREGVIHQDMPPAALAHLSLLDQGGPPGSRLIYVPFPGIGLEVRRQRTLVTDDMNFERSYRWEGRVRELIVALPASMEASGAGRRIRSRFADYAPDEWHAELHGSWWFWSVPAARSSP